MKHNNEARKTGGCLYKLLVFFLVITLGFGSCQKEDAIEIDTTALDILGVKEKIGELYSERAPN